MKKILLTLIVALAFCGSSFAQETHWPEFDYHQFQQPRAVVAYIQIDGNFVEKADNWANMEIAAFVGTECRGHKFMVDETDLGDEHPSVNLPVYYTTPGEAVTFQMFDHTEGLLYETCTANMAIETGTAYDGLWYGEEAVILSFTTPDMPFPHYPWTPSTAYSGEGMQVTAQIQIDGQPVDRDSFDVGAFCGEECRGNYKPLEDFDELGYFAMMNIMGNDGDVINFYLYDLENQSLVDGVCYTTVTLENGGELGIDIFGDDIFVLNFVTTESYIKPIAGYNNGGDYYFIASPIGEVNPDNVANMKANTYDLYWFKQDGDTDGNEWMNYKAENFNLVPGKGYLYANSNDVDLTFTGTAYTGTGTFDLDYIEDCQFPGMNLVGNPFAETTTIDRPFYRMVNGAYVAGNANEQVEAMEGVLVWAEATGEQVTFARGEGGKTSHLALNLVSSSKLVDRAIVNFGEEQQLAKFQFDANSTKLYFPMSDNDYAVISSQEMGELPVNFKAEKSGSYTIAVNSEEVSFGYLHLIDNLTGSDTDLLATPSYSFQASTTDYASRFKLVFATGNNDNENNFAYYSNGVWVINNDGKANVQVVDVAGRILSNEQIEGCYSLNFNAAPGVYMIRLINGENVKVQKVVVK